MKDSYGNELKVGDHFTCKEYGLCTVKEICEDGNWFSARDESGETFSKDIPDARKVLPYHDNVGEGGLKELRKAVGMLATKACFIVGRANPELTLSEKQTKALGLIHILLNEVT